MKQKIALLLAAALLLCSGVLARRAPRHVAPRAAELNFAFLTDVHVTPRGESDSLLRAAVAEINASAVDFVLVTGDLCNMGSDAELHCVHGILKRLRKPWFAVPGNHETTWSESACTTFGRLFGNDGRLAFRAGGYLFVGFTAGPYMKMADGSVRREDLQWVEEQMRAARPGERIVTFCHYPLTNDVTNRTAVTQLLRRYDVRFDLCGHYHTLRLCNFDSIPGLMGRSLIPKNRMQEPAAGTRSGWARRRGSRSQSRRAIRRRWPRCRAIRSLRRSPTNGRVRRSWSRTRRRSIRVSPSWAIRSSTAPRWEC